MPENNTEYNIERTELDSLSDIAAKKGKILAVDFGDVRTGVATSDPMGLIATGAGCIKSTNLRRTADSFLERKIIRVTEIPIPRPS